MNMDMDERIGSAAVDEGNSMETFHSNAVTSNGNTDPQFLMDGWPDISSSRSDVNFVQHRDLSLSGINNGANSEMQLKEDVYTSLTTQVKEEFPLSTSVYNSAIVEPGEIVLGEGSTYHSSFDPELLAKVDTDPETGKKTKSYPCTMCDKSFPYVSRLIRHVKSHTGEKSFQCTICPKAFTTRSSQERHLKIHSGERPFACPMCDKTYARRCVLEDHIRTHTGEKPYVCSVCGRAFASSSHLPEHMRTHTREKPFECPVCKKAFAGSSNLQKHIKIHNGITREEYLAQLQSNLDNAGAKRFECSVCGSTFSKRFNLQVHIRLHTGERPYECSFCGKGFTSSTELQVHIRKHTGERPYKCTLCENTYSRRSYLNIHMRSHSGERPFECSECGKTFTTTSNLQVHMKTHMGKVEKVNNHTVPKMLYSPQVEEQTEINTKYEDGESELLKPFGCAICGSVFSEELGLQEHVKTHTEES